MQDSRRILMALRRAYSSSSKPAPTPAPKPVVELSDSQKAINLKLPEREQHIEQSFSKYVKERELLAAKEAAKRKSKAIERPTEPEESFAQSVKNHIGSGLYGKKI